MTVAATRRRSASTVLVLLSACVLTALYVIGLARGWVAVVAAGLVVALSELINSVLAAAVRRRRYAIESYPMVSIVVPVLLEGEDMTTFDRTLAALAGQKWPAFEVIVVDDGSPDAAAVERICRQHGVRHLRQSRGGKRAAMALAFRHVHPDSAFVLTADDDTVWELDATRRLVACLQSDPGAGAAGGQVAALNPDDSWLTRVTSARYWYTFEVEFAAQAFAGVLTCVSGQLGIYRRELLDDITEDFVRQRFLGRPCTFGDDRHLTNLVLGRGYRVLYSGACAHAELAATLPTYLRQQTRWGKSYWRELLWTARALPRNSWWLAAGWVSAALTTPLLGLTLAWSVAAALTFSWSRLVTLIAVMPALAVLRAVPAAVARRRADTLWLMPVFAVWSIAVLLPLKLVSLVRVADSSWGTRGEVVVRSQPPSM